MLMRKAFERSVISTLSNKLPSACCLQQQQQVRLFKVQKNAQLVGVRSSEFAINKLIKRNPTAIPTKNPEAIHRAALEKCLSQNIATGSKTINVKLIRKVTPNFKKTAVPEAWVKNLNQEYTGLIKLNPYFFDCQPRKDILHQMVVWQLAKRRQGTAKTKYRTELAYSKKKMYNQKGTGNARHSDRGAPQFRGGGHAFPKIPRDFSFKLNRKVRRLALRMALTTKYQQGRLIVVDDLRVVDADGQQTFKTKFVKKAIDSLNAEARGFLIVGGEVLDKDFEKGSMALANVDALSIRGLNVYDMLRREYLVVSRQALEWLDSKYHDQIELNE